MSRWYHVTLLVVTNCTEARWMLRWWHQRTCFKLRQSTSFLKITEKKKSSYQKTIWWKHQFQAEKNIKHHIWRGWPNVNRHAAPWGCGPFFCPEFVPVPKTRIPKMVLARHTWLEEPSVQRQTLSTWPALATPIHGWWLDYYISHLNRVLYDTWF